MVATRIGQRGRSLRRTYFREWRIHRGLSQADLAARLGVQKGSIQKVETGMRMYSQSGLEAIAEALHCEPEDLIAGPPEQPSVAAAFQRAPDRVREAIRLLLDA